MKLNWPKRLLLGFQHTLAMFGATVLVPFLTGLDISVALFSARSPEPFSSIYLQEKSSSVLEVPLPLSLQYSQ